MNVRVRLFAAAKQVAGQDSVTVELPEGATVADLRRRLADDIPQPSGLLDRVLFSVNLKYAVDDGQIPSGAEVACIPPVSGG